MKDKRPAEGGLYSYAPVIKRTGYTTYSVFFFVGIICYNMHDVDINPCKDKIIPLTPPLIPFHPPHILPSPPPSPDPCISHLHAHMHAQSYSLAQEFTHTHT